MNNYRVELEDDNFEIFEAETDLEAILTIYTDYLDKGINVLWADRLDDDYDAVETIF